LHNTTRFFKDRHYLEREFKPLQAASSRRMTLLEFGCGVGNAFFPLLERLPGLFVTAFDLSAHAMRHIAAHPGYASGRVAAFACDAAAGNVVAAVGAAHDAWLAGVGRGGENHGRGASAKGPWATTSSNAIGGGAGGAHAQQIIVAPLPGGTCLHEINAVSAVRCHPPLTAGFDAVLLLFMLSAMPPEAHQRVWNEAAACLRPGGHVRSMPHCGLVVALCTVTRAAASGFLLAAAARSCSVIGVQNKELRDAALPDVVLGTRQLASALG
jgi:SAM-dependent methyltransferase